MNTKLAIIGSDSIFNRVMYDSIIRRDNRVSIIIINSYEKYISLGGLLSFSMIICDSVIDGASPLEIVYELRFRDRYVNPIFMMEDSENKQNIIKAFSVGVSRVFQRPYDPLEISLQIVSILKERGVL